MSTAHEVFHWGGFPITGHTSRPWRIHDVAPDFEVEDVWALPTPGDPGDLPRLVSALVSGDDFPKARRCSFAPCGRRDGRSGESWDGISARPASAPGSHRCATACPPTCAPRPTGPDFEDVPMTSNGWFGAAYMAAIKPFRHLFVYPALMRWVERAWQASASPNSTAPVARGRA